MALNTNEQSVSGKEASEQEPAKSRILLVENSKIVRNVLGKALFSLENVSLVKTASSIEEALALLTNNNNEFNCVISCSFGGDCQKIDDLLVEQNSDIYFTVHTGLPVTYVDHQLKSKYSRVVFKGDQTPEQLASLDWDNLPQRPNQPQQ